MTHVVASHNDALFITDKIKVVDVKEVLVDEGILLDIPFLKMLEKLGRTKDVLKKVESLRLGLSKRTTLLIGAINLPTALRK